MERDRTELRIDELSARVDRGFEEVDRRFGEVDRRFREVGRRFEEVDRRFEKVEGELREFRLETGSKLDRVNEEFVAMRKEIKDGFDAQRHLLLGSFGSLVVALVAYVFTH